MGKELVIFSIICIFLLSFAGANLPIASNIDLSLKQLEVIPGDNLTIKPEVSDQYNQNMDVKISVKLISPKKIERTYSIISGKIKTIPIALNDEPGVWKISSSFDNLFKEKEINVLKLEKAEFEFLTDGILIVKNIGNVIYDNTIYVKIGDKTETIEGINLKIGEERKFKISGQGQSEVSVSDGNSDLQGGMFLTGAVTGVKSFGSMDWSQYWTIGLFLMIILLALFLVWSAKSYYNHRKKNGMPVLFSTPKFTHNFSKNKNEIKEKFEEMKQYLPANVGNTGLAESSMVLEGKKYSSTILAIKINNFNKLRHGNEELNRVMELAKNRKAMVELKDGYILAIFSPIITRRIDGNELLAVQAANEILHELTAYNRMAIDKIEFGIGINSGELLSTLVKGKLKYTSIGTTILIARKIAESETGRIAIAESVRSKLLRIVKIGEIKTIGKTKVYQVNSLTDISANKAKFNDLMKRMRD